MGYARKDLWYPDEKNSLHFRRRRRQNGSGSHTNGRLSKVDESQVYS